MLNQKEQEAKDYMFNMFIPTLHEMVKEYAPDKYEFWNGNLCRQTAFAGTVFLREVLPEYDWQAWEGDFEDIVDGKNCRYEHAWIFGKHKETGKRLFLDLSHNYKERLFIETKVNAYPKDSEEHKDMKCLSRKRLDIDVMLALEEYNTNLVGAEFMRELMKRLMKKISIIDIMSYCLEGFKNEQ